ncbi:uncharacterized protein LOC116344733 isoform X2 [Contarinia nasturtii]|nr:uncharacterized protein LOC116344733 isoform X2 [Contarinia nasturtii]XP_031629283.1 uncharacterized protein LOC116344733 isoform X2 [Contarinia nasturtii]XP_031629284.1 uncharacterized protein LOC116344733 isoform X2 [Contarinia nasturtii]XP_031629285.1 uncharacterized protein LOC116344733 isoform X2 [Contarinia nasturtii]
MAIGSSVYQPTTVSYEPRPGSLLSQTTAVSPLQVLRKPYVQVILLTLGIISITGGIVLIVNASDDYEYTEEHRQEKPMEMVETAEAIDITLIVGGILLTLFGFVLVALYIKVAEWRRQCVCPCGLSKKQGLMARQLQTSGTQLPLNPSSFDPLVSHTQYAPVSELPRPDDEECRTLMTDNKDCLSSAEESDRMLDPDPRIVLRPLGHVEDA